MFNLITSTPHLTFQILVEEDVPEVSCGSYSNNERCFSNQEPLKKEDERSVDTSSTLFKLVDYSSSNGKGDRH